IQGNKFLLAPDGQKLAVIQKQGVVIVPLTEALGGSSQFLPNYTDAIGFSADGESILTVGENQDYTRSLFLVSKEGLEKELFRTVGTIDQCLFEPRQQRELYCLTTNLVPTPSGYEQEPSLSAIDLETGQDSPILALTNYKEVNLSMSADGLSLLFDQIVTTNSTPNELVLTDSGKAISAGNIWILSLSSLQSEDNPEILYPPQALISGFKPRWVP
nr:hypothetical protein [Prochloraceae cyanobacterium]